MAGNVNQFLQIPFQMLKTFHIPVSEFLSVIDQVVVVHDRGRFGQFRQDVVFHEAFQILVHMGGVQGQPFISVKADAGSGSIDENNGIIPIQQRGGDTAGANFIRKGMEPSGMTFLKLGEIWESIDQWKAYWLKIYFRLR